LTDKTIVCYDPLHRPMRFTVVPVALAESNMVTVPRLRG